MEGLWSAILGFASVVLTSILIPLYRSYKKRNDQIKKNNELLTQLPSKLNSIEQRMDKIEEGIIENRDVLNNIITKQEENEEKFDQLETMQLKHMINDAFFGHDSVRDIPDEELISASQCCDIYLGKGLNHETGARCKIIYEELERRQRIRSGIDNGGE